MPLAPHRWGGPGPSNEHATPDAAICLLAHVVKHRSDLEHHVLVLGSAAAARHAAALGIRARCVVSPALGLPSLSLSTLRRVLDRINPEAAFEWEGGTMNASSLEALHSSPTFHINALSGVIGHLAESGPLASLPACAEPLRARAPHTRFSRASLRTMLGIPEATLLIALLGDHPTVASATTFASMLGILHSAGIDAMGLVSPGSLHHNRAMRQAAAPGYIPRIISSAALPTLLAACDAAVLCPPGAHLRGEPRETEFIESLEAALAIGAGVPVVAGSSDAMQKLCGTLSPMLLTKDSESATLARALAIAVPDVARALELSEQVATLGRSARLDDSDAGSLVKPEHATCDRIIAALGEALLSVAFLRESTPTAPGGRAAVTP